MNLLTKLMDEMKTAAQGGVEPDCEVARGEKVVGILPDDAKGLYYLMRAQDSVVERLQEKLEKHGELYHGDETSDDHNDEECAKLRNEVLAFSLQKEVINNLFWNSVRLSFMKEIGDSGVGIRKGWKVVKLKKQSSPLTGLLFGMMMPPN